MWRKMARRGGGFSSRSRGLDLTGLPTSYDDEPETRPAPGCSGPFLWDLPTCCVVNIVWFLSAQAVYGQLVLVSKKLKKMFDNAEVYRGMVESTIQNRYKLHRRLAGPPAPHSVKASDLPPVPGDLRHPPSSERPPLVHHGRFQGRNRRVLRRIEEESEAFGGSWRLFLISLFVTWKLQPNIAVSESYTSFLDDSDDDDFVDDFADDGLLSIGPKPVSQPSPSSTVLYVRNSNVLNLDERLENRHGTFRSVAKGCQGFSASAKEIKLIDRTVLSAQLLNDETGSYVPARIDLLDAVRLGMTTAATGAFLFSLEWREP